MKTALRILLFLMVAAVAAIVSSVYWLQTPAGEKFVSDRLTAQMQMSVPKTELRVQGISVRFPMDIRIQRVIWRGADADPIAMLSPCVVRLRPRGFSAARLALEGVTPPGASALRLQWNFEGQVTRLQLAPLDRAFGKGEWHASGEAAGILRMNGVGEQTERIHFQVEIIHPGGGISSEFLLRLLGLMPEDKSKAVLFKALASRPIVHFSTGRISLITENGDYLLQLWLDGDHLLDITIRVPQESLALIRTLLQ